MSTPQSGIFVEGSALHNFLEHLVLDAVGTSSAPSAIAAIRDELRSVSISNIYGFYGIFRVLIERMFGGPEDDVHDRLFEYSKPVTSTTWFSPSLEDSTKFVGNGKLASTTRNRITQGSLPK